MTILPPTLPKPSPPTLSPCTTTTATTASRPSTMITSINILAYLISTPLLCYGMWLLLTRDFSCSDYLHLPLHLRAVLGVSLIAIFALSCFATHYGAKVLMPGALALAIVLLGMMVFGILLKGNYAVEGRGVPASPLWVKDRIDGNKGMWEEIKACIYRSRTCSDLAYSTVQLSADEFSKKKLPLIESGCCTPPRLCGMEYVNATYWKRMSTKARATNDTDLDNVNATYWKRMSTKARATNDTDLDNDDDNNSGASNSNSFKKINPKTYGDCLVWNNELTQLCYDCQSCKQDFVSAVHHSWWGHGVFMITMSVVLIAVHTLRFVMAMMQRNMN